MNRYLFSFLFLILFCLLGCSNPLEQNSQNPFSIKTDKTHYSLSEDDSVKVTITNESSQTIFYSTCFAKTIEVIKDNKITESLGTPVCYCICEAKLKPGESIPLSISSLSSEFFQYHSENHFRDESAEYQIRYSFYYDKAFGDEPVPNEYSRSNRFKLTAIEQ